MVRYYPSEEHTPEAGRIVIGYSAVFGTYMLCNFEPTEGWRGLDGHSLTNITHWLDQELYLPFEITNETNFELAKKYKLS
jgi:hypothetical protein